MDRLRFGIWLLAGLLFVALPLPVHADTSTAAATPIDVVSAVNMAGGQRLLSQRMVKA